MFFFFFENFLKPAQKKEKKVGGRLNKEKKRFLKKLFPRLLKKWLKKLNKKKTNIFKFAKFGN